MPYKLQLIGRMVHDGVRPFFGAVLFLQFSVQCGPQPLPVLPLDRFGTKNTYRNAFRHQHEDSDFPNAEETKFCCPPVQVEVDYLLSFVSFLSFVLLFGAIVEVHVTDKYNSYS